MTTNGKQKGARAELVVSRLFHAWWVQVEPMVGEEPLTFKRTPGSGGWAHGKGRAAFGTSADLVTNSKAFPFAVECKHREGWSWPNFLKGGKSPVWGWWEQAVNQAAEVKKHPLLAFRMNHEPWRFMVKRDAIPMDAFVALHKMKEHEPLRFDRTESLGLDHDWVHVFEAEGFLKVNPGFWFPAPNPS